jgi:hypothetical protein
MPSAVSGRAAKLAIRVLGEQRSHPRSPPRDGWVGHGAQAVAYAAVDHLVAFVLDQADMAFRVVIDDIDRGLDGGQNGH